MTRTRDETLIQAFSDVLRQERDRLGLSQEALAFECGIARTYIGLLEAKKRQPALSILFAIARGLALSPNTLIARVDKRFAELLEAGR